MSNSKNHETVYGTIGAAKLEELQQRFDTTRILAAVDAIDRLRYQICNADGVRDDLLNLHSMAHTLINGDTTMDAPLDSCIWELAQDLELELGDYADSLQEIADLVAELGELAPVEEWDDDLD